MKSDFFRNSALTTIKAISLIFVLTFTLWNDASAKDFAAEINNAAYAEGHRVIYEMNVGSFTSQGTLSAAQTQLAAMKSFGVDIVWLMPIYPRGTSGSPYAPTDFQKVNPKYGSVADLKAFVTEAHRLGMEVWLDWVPNHTATNAAWVTSHPEYYLTVGGNMVHPNNYNDVWQLDYSNTGLVNAMNDCLKFWVDQCDIDGYRCDYVSSSRIPASYWASTIPQIKSYKEGKNVSFLAETDVATDQTRLKNVGFDYDYAWGFQSSLASFGSGTSVSQLKSNINWLLSTSTDLSFGRMVYLTNHDQNFNDGGHTISSVYGTNRYLLTVVTFTIYGMPMLYNGQEIGGDQILNYFSDTKIDWAAKDAKMYNTIHTLSALKHAVPALYDSKTSSGNPSVGFPTVTGNSYVTAYTRTNGDSQVLVVVNLGNSDATATISGLNAGEWSLWLDSSTIGRGTSRKTVNFDVSQQFSLEAKGYRVYVKGHYSEESDITEETPLGDLTDDSPCAVFYECPDEATIRVWLWNDAVSQFTAATWPGDAMTRLGITTEGKVVYKYVVNVPEGKKMPTNIIFTKNGGSDSNKTFDGAFVNHGYYIEGQGVATIIIPEAGVDAVVADKKQQTGDVYTITGINLGRNPQNLPSGIYIRNGEKFIIRRH